MAETLWNNNKDEDNSPKNLINLNCLKLTWIV